MRRPIAADVFVRLGIRYFVSRSVAAMFYGESKGR